MHIIKYVPPRRVCMVFGPFGSENGYIDFAHFGLESDFVFEETKGVYKGICRLNSKLIRRK